MVKKAILRTLIIVTLLYPAYMLFLAHAALGAETPRVAEEGIIHYQLSIWISWIFLVSVAVFYKWTESRNFFFYFTYAFLAVAFAVYGYLHQEMITVFDLPSFFVDSYTLGVLVAFQNLIVSGILTAFLQGSVWWFTRRWHRR
jgi:hypothetical protein